MVYAEKMTGVRVIGRVEVPPELWAALHSAAMEEDVRKGKAYGSQLSGSISAVETPEDPGGEAAGGFINVWATPGGQAKALPLR